MASVSDSPVSLATWRASCSVALFLMNKGMFLVYILARSIIYHSSNWLAFAGNRSLIALSGVPFLFLLPKEARMPKRSSPICSCMSFATLVLVLISRPAPNCNHPGKQDRDPGARPRVRLRIESRHASPDLHRCGLDSRPRRSTQQRHYPDGPPGLR